MDLPLSSLQHTTLSRIQGPQLSSALVCEELFTASGLNHSSFDSIKGTPMSGAVAAGADRPLSQLLFYAVPAGDFMNPLVISFSGNR